MQRGFTTHSLDVDVAASTAVSAICRTSLDVFLAQKGYASMTASAGMYADRAAIDEW